MMHHCNATHWFVNTTRMWKWGNALYLWHSIHHDKKSESSNREEKSDMLHIDNVPWGVSPHHQTENEMHVMVIHHCKKNSYSNGYGGDQECPTLGKGPTLVKSHIRADKMMKFAPPILQLCFKARYATISMDMKETRNAPPVENFSLLWTPPLTVKTLKKNALPASLVL